MNPTRLHPSETASTAAVTVVLASLSLLLAPPTLSAAPASGTIRDVRHVVIFMQENRSFDHYFGTLAGVRGFGDRSAVVFTNGNTVFQQPFGKSTLLPFHVTTQCVEDLDHSWGGSHDAWHKGKWDGWVAAKTTTTMAYYNRAELPYYYALADAFTICDGYFCSVLGPTNPNRLYLWTGMIDPRGTGGGPAIDNSEPGYRWTTYPERLQKAGVSWKIYQQVDNYDDNALAWFNVYTAARPGNPLHDRGMVFVNDITTAFASDVAHDTLPEVSWIIAATADSEHPSDSPASGAFITHQLLQALAANPAVYASTVFILNYDENDGFYDHVTPPVPPAGTPDEFVGGLPIGLGVRVPCILVSPWTRGGYVCSEIFDHTSIIRFLEQWTGVQEPNISAWRRKVCGDLTSAFDFTSPNTNFPALPPAARVVCPGGTSPVIPKPQVSPTQEPGARPVRPLPYQPEARLIADPASGRVQIVMTNSGTANTHLSIHPTAYRGDGPWHYDVAPGGNWTDSFIVTTNGGRYDFSCYGPNGFLRRFGGSISNDLASIDAWSEIDANAGSITLHIVNPSTQPVTFTVSAPTQQPPGTWSYPVAAGGRVDHVYDAVQAGRGTYEFTITAAETDLFLRRFVGRIETSPLRLTVVAEGGGLVARFPAWVETGAVLEGTSSLAPATWTPVLAPRTREGSFTRVGVVPPDSGEGTLFLRVRRPE